MAQNRVNQFLSRDSVPPTPSGPLLLAGEGDMSMLENGRLSDVTVTCGAYSWTCHRAVLCECSAYFARYFAENPDIVAFNLSMVAPENVGMALSMVYGFGPPKSRVGTPKDFYETICFIYQFTAEFEMKTLTTWCLEMLAAPKAAIVNMVQASRPNVQLDAGLARGLVKGAAQAWSAGSDDAHEIQAWYVDLALKTNQWILADPIISQSLHQGQGWLVDCMQAFSNQNQH